MTNWNRIKEIDRINQRELDLNIGPSASWHVRYSHSAYIYVGNIHFDLNEGDLITVLSQFGEIVDCNLIRDKETGDPKGFAFIAFENQKSTNLAVDNMNGAVLLKRTLNVDHVNRYRKPKHFKDRENKIKENKYGDIDEDDETYQERRKKIWDYQKYYGLNNNDHDYNYDENKQTVKFDQNEVDRINKQYLNQRKNKEDEFKKDKSDLDKKIEIRKLKRQLLRMRRNENKYDRDENDRNKRFERKDNNDDKDEDKWIDNGSELRDKFGRVIDIEKELEKRKRLEDLEKKEEYELELKQIKEEKKRKKRSKKTKSELLNSK